MTEVLAVTSRKRRQPHPSTAAASGVGPPPPTLEAILKATASHQGVAAHEVYSGKAVEAWRLAIYIAWVHHDDFATIGVFFRRPVGVIAGAVEGMRHARFAHTERRQGFPHYPSGEVYARTLRDISSKAREIDAKNKSPRQ